MTTPHVVSSHLIRLRGIYQAAGFDIRLVGGVVRDLITGQTPKDIDLCTDATPEQQTKMLKEHNIHYIETGLSHGTITVWFDEAHQYEITTLRTETDHDGRHAVVEYTTDWIADLGRRDLTINAMSMTFDGELVDPYDGKGDALAGMVRFVGNANDRIKEDYLRILRYFRFFGRFASGPFVDAETTAAIVQHGQGLTGISKERVWQEFSKIIVGRRAAWTVESIYELGVDKHIGLSPAKIDMTKFGELSLVSKEPITMMVSIFEGSEFPSTFTDWKMSTAQVRLAKFLWEHKDGYFDTDDFKRMIVFGEKIEHVTELMALTGHSEEEIATMSYWIAPTFPVSGHDIKALVSSPREIGEVLSSMKDKWAESGYSMTKEDLMGTTA